MPVWLDEQNVGCYGRILTKYTKLWFISLAKDHESGNNASSKRNPQKYYILRPLNLLQHKQRASKLSAETKTSRFIQIWAELNVSEFMTAGQGEPNNLGLTFDDITWHQHHNASVSICKSAAASFFRSMCVQMQHTEGEDDNAGSRYNYLMFHSQISEAAILQPSPQHLQVNTSEFPNSFRKSEF